MNPSPALRVRPLQALRRIGFNRGSLFGLILLGALVAFEIFNFSTTDFALRDVLGDLRFLGIRWATILSLAFCGIDFAGLARLFTPEQGRDEPAEVWYLFGAWILAAMMNAVLTWWGVAVAISGHSPQAASVMPASTLTRVVPVFVAVMVWVIRILIIGTFSVAGDHIFATAESRPASRPVFDPGATRVSTPRPAPRPGVAAPPPSRVEPTYHPVGASMSAAAPEERRSAWR